MTEKLLNYWRLILNEGVSLQKGQRIVITAPVECAVYTRAVAEEAYNAGAKQVIVRWVDDSLTRLDYQRANDTVFDVCDPWIKSIYNTVSKEGGAFLNLYAPDPENLKGIDPGKIVRSRKAYNNSLKAHRERTMSNQVRWCVAAVPSQAWAAKVFPGLPAQGAFEKLWHAILTASRVGDWDVMEQWRQHAAVLRQRCDTLNAYRFHSLHYTSANGTDLHVGLANGHLWEGGKELSADGIPFSANIPSEEVFTCPDKTRVEGVVKSSKPLIYQGNIIDQFTVWFHNGKAVRVTAEKGQELLEKLIQTDRNAAYLGEVALVPYHSPISESNILFYNTLFDENAACHFAFGAAYPHTVSGAVGKTDKQLAEAGINKSTVHEDFMVGTADLSIVGEQQNGALVPVFQDGDFVL